MKIIFVKEENCPSSVSLENKLDEISQRMNDVSIEKMEISEVENTGIPICIVPALLCNGTVLSYGDISEQRITQIFEKLKE